MSFHISMWLFLLITLMLSSDWMVTFMLSSGRMITFSLTFGVVNCLVHNINFIIWLDDNVIICMITVFLKTTRSLCFVMGSRLRNYLR
jgi:hypothetical protein